MVIIVTFNGNDRDAREAKLREFLSEMADMEREIEEGKAKEILTTSYQTSTPRSERNNSSLWTLLSPSSEVSSSIESEATRFSSGSEDTIDSKYIIFLSHIQLQI